MAGEPDEEVMLESLEQKYTSPRPTEPEPEEPGDGVRYYEPVRDEGPGLGTTVLRVALWIATVAGGFAVARVFWDGLEARGLHGDSGQRWFAIGALAVLALGVFALLDSYRGRDRREALIGPFFGVALVIVALSVAVDAGKGNNDQLVSDYCSYGAQSLAQLGGCLRSVTPGEVVYSDTPAANFANGKNDDCGIGSGPFCGEAAFSREARRALSEHERSP